MKSKSSFKSFQWLAYAVPPKLNILHKQTENKQHREVITLTIIEISLGVALYIFHLSVCNLYMLTQNP